MFCPNCGSNIDDNAVFCGECGTRISAAAPVPTPPVQTPPEQMPAEQIVPVPEVAEQAGKKLPGWLKTIIVLLIVAVVGVASALVVKHFMDNKDDKEDKKPKTSETDAGEGNGVAVDEETATVPNEDPSVGYSETESETYPEIVILHTKVPTTVTEAPELTMSKPETTKPPTTTKPSTTKAPTTKAPTTKAPTTKAPTTKAPTTTAPSGYLPAVSGFSDSQIESAMEAYIRSNNWSNFSKYILPGSANIVKDMINMESSQGYDTYLSEAGSSSINEYRIYFKTYPPVDDISYKYYRLDKVDKLYQDNSDYGLYEIVKTVLNKYYGTNIKYKDLILMETIVTGTDGEDYGFYVLLLQTDKGFFFLCD